MNDEHMFGNELHCLQHGTGRLRRDHDLSERREE